MKTFGKIVICVLVIISAIGIAYLIYNGEPVETSSNTASNNENANNNEVIEDNVIDKNDENTNYIGEEENKEEEIIEEEAEKADSEEKNDTPIELTGKDKAIDIVEKKYALEGQTVRYDHMEGENYVIKINEGTAQAWYIVDGTTWEAEEY